jgi:signal transduction histidine kinase
VLNGEDKTFMSTKFPLIDDEGRPYAIGGISVDITERKKMENDLRFAVEARDRFLNIASHELKTPLTSMKLQLQVYRRQLQKGNRELLDESRLMKLVADTLRQTSTLERLVNDMLDISRINTGKLHYEFQETDLCRLIEDVSESLRPGIEANGGELTLDICEHIHGNWDRQRIEQVIVNLITNASKYGKGKPIHVRSFQSGEFGIIEVIDEGMGVAPEDQKRIFDQFERAVNQNEVSGFGLGLYISRKIVEAHQGLITVQSIKGQGSTFTVALPTHLNTKHEGHISL